MSHAIDPLLSPLRIKGVVFRNRIMSTSHACGLEEDGGMPKEKYQRYHEEKARGGIGLTMFGGSAYVSEDSTWATGQLNMSSDRIIAYLQSFSGRIHDAGAAIMMQLTHLGRRGETNTQNWLSTIAPSAARETGHRSIPREMDRHDIERVVRAFGDAAYRARQGGLDGIETMIGGHLIGQFLSPRTNWRTDEFGGSLENRCRFGLMVHEQIRKYAGDDFLVGMRFPIDEAIEGGLNFDDCLEIADIFQHSGLIDFFNANYGSLDTELRLLTDCMPSMSSPLAPWLQIVGEFKKSVKLPVFHAARITDLATARYALRENLLDMVAMTRAHIADPNIVKKIKESKEDQIRPCAGLTHCMGDNRPTCIHNPSTGREQYWPHAVKSRHDRHQRAVVVGGGPAGLEAARILALRGHIVTLFEASGKLGGQVNLAAHASWRKDILTIIDWRESELRRLGVKLVFDTYASEEDIMAVDPGIVIVATGGVPGLGRLEGSEHCISTWDCLSGMAKPAGEVIIFDGTGRHPALTAAQFCHDAGSDVQLVLIDDRPAAELDYGERVIWKRELASRNIAPVLDHSLCRVDHNGSQFVAVITSELTGEHRSITAEQVIVELGTLPADDIYQNLRSSSRNNGITDIPSLVAGNPQPHSHSGSGFVLYRIGDASSSRNLAAAFYDALRLCSVL